jgi:uncharacterized damage-inducible protein DinB
LKKTLCILMAACASAAVVACAQEGAPAAQAPATAPANPISASEKGIYSYVSREVVAAAEKMPEENYSFKPTPEVRSFGQIVGHIADSQYYFCATATGEQPQMKNIEKTKTSKADLVAALKEAVAYCQTAYAGMTDTQGAQMTKMMNFDMAKLSVLSLNAAHMNEHYGNLVTYMRLKGLVPPSSEKQPGQGQK